MLFLPQTCYVAMCFLLTVTTLELVSNKKPTQLKRCHDTNSDFRALVYLSSMHALVNSGKPPLCIYLESCRA